MTHQDGAIFVQRQIRSWEGKKSALSLQRVMKELKYAMCLCVFMLVYHRSPTSLHICKELFIDHMFFHGIWREEGFLWPSLRVSKCQLVFIFLFPDFNMGEDAREPRRKENSALEKKTNKTKQGNQTDSTESYLSL